MQGKAHERAPLGPARAPAQPTGHIARPRPTTLALAKTIAPYRYVRLGRNTGQNTAFLKIDHPRRASFATPAYSAPEAAPLPRRPPYDTCPMPSRPAPHAPRRSRRASRAGATDADDAHRVAPDGPRGRGLPTPTTRTALRPTGLAGRGYPFGAAGAGANAGSKSTTCTSPAPSKARTMSGLTSAQSSPPSPQPKGGTAIDST